MNPQPNLIRSKARSLRVGKPGFALVVTLSLMVLLSILAVGLLSLSSVSLRASARADADDTARSNARLALMMAIAQMQETTGPDQRVTVPADQRPKGADGKETAAAVGNRHWTGVYRSWPATAKDRPASPEFISWLVSGNAANASSATLADSAAADAVELVGGGTLGGAATNAKVSVPALRIKQPNGKEARLAWWVGDQGIKAAVTTPLPGDATALGAIRSSLQGAPRNAVELAAAGTVKPFATIDPSDNRFASVTSWQSAGFIASDPKAPQPLFHDLAPYSTGLLTNVAAGGFRKDLSMLLEKQPTGTGVNAPPDPTTTALYTVKNIANSVATTTYDEPGINLNELWVYYNSYKDIKRSGGYNYTTSEALASPTPHMLLESSPDLCRTDFEFFLKQPTIISYQMVLSLKTLPVIVGGVPLERVHLVADPIITLWNPLDIPVVIPQTACIAVTYWQIPYDLNVSVNGVNTFSAPLVTTMSAVRSTSGTTTGAVDLSYLTVYLGSPSAEQIVLKPGEVVKFSQSGGLSTLVAGSAARHAMIAKKGFNYDGGFAFQLRDLTNKFVDLVANDILTYSLSANKYTAGATDRSGFAFGSSHSGHFSLTQATPTMRPPPPTAGWGYGNMSLDAHDGSRRAKLGVTYDKYNNKPPADRLSADNFPNFFPPIASPNTRPLSTANLIANKAPIMLLSFDAKTEGGSVTATRSMMRFNPKATSVDFYELTPDEMDRMPYEFRVEPMVSWVSRSLDLSPDGSGFFGGGMDGALGTNRVITHSIPREPLVSLAAFQHSFANGFGRQRPSDPNPREPMLPQISHAIGNSLAPAILAPDKTEGNLKAGRPVADHSYLANRGLWDDYFLSSVAPQEAVTFGAARDQKTVATEFFSKDPALSKPLPVVRYKPDTDGIDPATLLASFFSGTNPTSLGTTNLASYLRVDGLFNVNSTSVEAWKAMLGSLKGRPIVVREADGKEKSIDPAGTDVPVIGLQNPDDLIADGSGSVDIRNPSQWVGRRELKETEIDTLAKALVAEIRKRGPFLSLADFVNRRVGSDKNLARAGALQSALDDTSVGLNKAYGTVGAAASRFAFPEAEQGPTSFGIPGIVKQADILTPIAPVLSVRSDCFIVRAYGEAVDASGNVTARAWCEAVVERDRNFVDPTDNATTLPAALNAVNAEFGRRYEIVSFRWLASSEI